MSTKMLTNMLKEPDLATFGLLSSILRPSSNKIPKAAKGFEAFSETPLEDGQIIFVRAPSRLTENSDSDKSSFSPVEVSI